MSSLYLGALYSASLSSPLPAPSSSAATSASNASVPTYNTQLNARLGDATSISMRQGAFAALAAGLQSFTSTLAALRDSSQTAGIAGSSDNAAVQVMVGANAKSGLTSVSVTQLAQAQANASDDASSADQAAGFTAGTLTFQEGNNQGATVNVTAAMSLNDLASAINRANAHVTASVEANGSKFRLVVTGQDTGLDNAVTYGENGTNVGLVNNGLQAAANLQGTANGRAFTSQTNSTPNAVMGTTLNFSNTFAQASVQLTASATSASAGIQAFVTTYNNALAAVTAAQASQADAGVLTSLQTHLASFIGRRSSGAQGSYSALAQIGVTSNSDGTLAINAATLNQAASNDAASVASLLSGTGYGTNGLAYDLQQASKAFSAPADGILSQNQYGLQSQASTNGYAILRASNFADSYSNMLSANNTFYRKRLSDLTGASLLVQTLPTY